MPLKLDIRILIPALPFDPNDPFAKSLGGSETAGLQLAKALSGLGHTVTCFASVEASANWGKVNIVPAGSFESTMVSIPCDLCIVQRAPQAFMRRYGSRVNLLWVHDLMFARRGPELQSAMHSIDRIVTVSQFQKDQWRKVVPGVPESSYVVARNGLDLELVAAARERGMAHVRPDRRPPGMGTRREKGLIVCGARPERGIDVLLTQVFPRILKDVPHARLALAAYDCPNPQTQPFYDQLRQIAANFGPERVTWHGALNKAELYDLYHRAELYLYPTPSPSDTSFAETSCISVMEAMACGCPVIASMRGGLVETVGGNGILVDVPEAHAATEGVVGRFVEEAVGLLADRDRWDELGRRGVEATTGLGWEPVAQQFVDTAVAILGEQCADPVRLARHFIRRQDIEAAGMVVERALAAAEEPQRNELREIASWMSTRYEHTRSPRALAAYCDEAALANQGTFDGLMEAPPPRFDSQPFGRFEMIESALRAQLELPPYPARQPSSEPLRILDFGSNGGELAIVLGNRLGNVRLLGVDASPREVERARKLADAKAAVPGNLAFAVQNEADLALVEDEVARHGPFDAVVLAEVLERLVDPVALVEKLEGMVRTGGVVVGTVPYGPWETQQPEHRRGAHLREWLAADLIDMFVNKPSLQLNIAPQMVCPTSGEMCGNTIWHYKVDHAPLGQIDWDRKLTMQRPRQTLSACMILGGGNDIDNLHWCLKPVAAVADEIVVGDTGMSDEARRILRQYPGVRIVPDVPSPLAAGFDVARNRVLDQCREDWVLMVDADEHLLSPSTLSRYLRENVYHSYAMPQFHFAVDAAWKPDLPGRLFRRRANPEGRTVHFVGRLHEHPEFGVNEGAGMAMLLQDVRLAHVGYIEQANRAQRYMRNLPLLRLDMETHPKRELIRLVMCRDTMIQAKYLMALAGLPHEPGQAQQHEMAANLCRDVIGIFDQTFVDNPSAMANEAMEFYSEACKYLGTDVRADGLSVNRQGVGPAMGPTATWFASVDHYKRWMARSVRAATESLEVPGF